MDLIGPYTIGCKNKPSLTLQVLTMIDPATGWFEIQQYKDKRAVTIANILEQVWLSRYPWPTLITYDQGSEFLGYEFECMVQEDYGITSRPTVKRNPQANAIIERVHQVIANMIRTYELETNYMDEENPWAGILAATAFAVRATYHTTLQATPGQLVFGRDMILNAVHMANWKFITERKQKLINANNEQENAKCIPHTYKIGDLVLLKKDSRKYECSRQGPYKITKIYTNGTVTIKKGAVYERINIRRLQPYYE